MNATSALGWALLGFLWQGTLIALLARLLLALLPANRAPWRYGIAAGALALMPATVLYSTWHGLHAPPPFESALAGAPGRATSAFPAGAGERAKASPPAELEAHPAPAVNAATSGSTEPAGAPRSWSWRARIGGALPWVVGAWAFGALALSLRLLSGYAATRRLVRGRLEPAPETVQRLLARLAARLGVRRAVRVGSSELTRVPAVVGWLSPVVLLPASAVSGLSPAQLEAILAHELAHVRRHDYLVNVLQSLVETLLFYHPAVWWLGARLRAEREHCCDDMAVAACGSAPDYAEALLSLEHLRGGPRLAPAVTGGSLLARVERLLAPRGRRLELFPRWLAGMSAAAIVVLFFGTSTLARAAAQQRERIRTVDPVTGAGDVLVHPEPARPMSQRNDWAQSEAARGGYGEFWIGHSIAPAPDFTEGILMARFDHTGGLVVDGEEDRDLSGLHVTGVDADDSSLTLIGRILTVGNVDGLRLPGVPLAPLVGADPADVAVLYLCSARSGRTSIRRVHLATARLAVDLEGLPLLWLGRAEDDESIRDALARMEQVGSSELLGDLVGVVGAHGTSSLVVPELARILDSSRDEEARSEAAEWLAHHPVMDALRALDGAARRDRSEQVRCEAAEAVSEMRFAPAFEVLVALAHELEDPEARREAVEGLAARPEPGAVAVLEDIANNDRDVDVRCEAVETLGDVPAGAGLSAIAAIAHGHPDQEVRCEAVETFGQCAEVDQALAFLQDLVASDPASDVRREAVETLGELRDERVVGILIRIVDGREDPDVQCEAVETLGATGAAEAVLPVLERIALDHGSNDVRCEACETLGELHDERVVEVLTRIAGEADDPDVQREAVETLGGTFLGAATVPVLERIARSHPVLDVQREAVETLGDLDTEEDHSVLDVVAALAADHPAEEVRAEAVETLGDHLEPALALALFDRLLRSERSPRVREELQDALESARSR